MQRGHTIEAHGMHQETPPAAATSLLIGYYILHSKAEKAWKEVKNLWHADNEAIEKVFCIEEIAEKVHMPPLYQPV